MTHGNQDKLDWLVMLYVAADDVSKDNLDEATLVDECDKMLEKLKSVSIAKGIAVVVLTDDNLRPDNPKKYPKMTPGIRVLHKDKWRPQPLDNEIRFMFDVVDGPPELDTGTPSTLAHFLNWAIEKYPADKRMLSIIGHGGGWSAPQLDNREFPQQANRVLRPVAVGGSFQPNKGVGHSPSLNGLCPDMTSNTALSTLDLRIALASGLGGRMLDVLFLDACLMGMIEVAYEIKEHVRYLIAGQSLLWTQLPYNIYLSSENLSADTSAAELARRIVYNYNSISDRVQKSWAVAAIDLEQIESLRDQVNKLANELLQRISPKQDKREIRQTIARIAQAYYECQQFDDNADLRVDHKESYVDLYDFVAKLSEKIPDLSSELGYGLNSEQLALGREAAVADSIKKLFVLDNEGRVHRNADQPQGAIEDRIPKDIVPNKAIFAVLAQTDLTKTEKEPQVIHLENAYGLSIYFPFGDIINEADNMSIKRTLERDLAQFASTHNESSLVNLLRNIIDAIDDVPADGDNIAAKELLDLHLEGYTSQLLFSQDKSNIGKASSPWAQLIYRLRDALTGMDEAERDEVLSFEVVDGEPWQCRLQASKRARVFNSPRQRTQ